MKCAFCEFEVDADNPDTFREVSSWVNGPKLDGPKLRQQTGRLAHAECIERTILGQAPDQDELEF